MRRLIVGGLAAALLAGLPGVATAAPTTTTIAAPTPLTTAEREEIRRGFRKGMIEGGGDLVSWAMAEYPDEFRRMEDDLIAGFESGKYSTEELTRRAAQFVLGIRERLVAYMQQAPDAEIRAMLEGQVRLLRYLGTVNPKICYEFGENGALSLESSLALTDDARKKMADYSSVTVKAVVAGKRTPVTRQPLDQSSFPAILAAYNASGGNMAWLEAAGTGDFSSVSAANRCSGSIAMLEAVLAQPDAIVGRFIVTR